MAPQYNSVVEKKAKSQWGSQACSVYISPLCGERKTEMTNNERSSLQYCVLTFLQGLGLEIKKKWPIKKVKSMIVSMLQLPAFYEHSAFTSWVERHILGQDADGA